MRTPPSHIRAGTAVIQPRHIAYWYSALLKLAGASLEQKLPLDERDVWGTIAEGPASPHAEILINAAPTSGAIRAGNWKLVLNGDGHSTEVNRREQGREVAAAAAKIEPFDLASDAGEQRNLAEAHPEKVRDLRARYQALASQAVPPKLAPRDPNFKTPAVWGETR